MDSQKKDLKLGEQAVNGFDAAQAVLKYRINPQTSVIKPQTILEYNGLPIWTLGNISSIKGPAKGRKTTGTIALFVAANGGESLPGLSGNINGLSLWIDTEQSEYHAHRTAQRISQMLGLDNANQKYEYYGLRPLAPNEILITIEHLIYNRDNLRLIVIDGVRDLLSIGINDEQEATALLSKFKRWTYERNVHIVLIIHQNKADSNARGHIGAELTNKSETVFCIAKDPKNKAVSIITAEYTRDIDFEPFTFSMSPDGLPEPYTTFETTSTRLIDSIREGMKKVLPGMVSMGYNELVEEYAGETANSIPTAKRHIKLAKGAGIITYSMKKYKLNTITDESDVPPF